MFFNNNNNNKQNSFPDAGPLGQWLMVHGFSPGSLQVLQIPPTSKNMLKLTGHMTLSVCEWLSVFMWLVQGVDSWDRLQHAHAHEHHLEH